MVRQLAVGTVLGSAIQYAVNNNPTLEIYVLSKSSRSRNNVNDRAAFFNKIFKSNIKVSHYCLEELSDTYERSLEIALNILKPNAAIVSTPDHTHFEIVSLLISRGIHTLCVKPLVETVEKHMRLIH